MISMSCVSVCNQLVKRKSDRDLIILQIPKIKSNNEYWVNNLKTDVNDK